MPTYKVLRQIEHDGKIYFPAGTEGVPKTLPSGAHGKDAPTDTSGAIELTEEQAAALGPAIHSQIPVFDADPDSIEAAKTREAAAAKKKKKE